MAKVGVYYRPNFNNAESFGDDVLLLVTQIGMGRVRCVNVKSSNEPVVVDRSDFDYYYESAMDIIGSGKGEYV